jgi:hypothetical protein
MTVHKLIHVLWDRAEHAEAYNSEEWRTVDNCHVDLLEALEGLIPLAKTHFPNAANNNKIFFAENVVRNAKGLGIGSVLAKK